MDSMEVNKGIAAVLVGGIAFFLTGLIGDTLVRERELEKSVLNIAVAPAATGGGEAKPAGPAPIAPLLASADPKAGDQFVHRVCTACHTFDKGGKPSVGPNLYGVVGGPHDHEPGFNYSPAMEKFKGQPWTFDALNEWLFKPSAYAPGTRMSFAGIPSDKQRADVIDYLRTLSDNPVPLPAAEAAQKPAEAAQKPPASATTGAPTGGGTAAVQPNAPNTSGQPATAPGAGPPAGGSESAPAAPAPPKQ
jgi:cytochrome c